MAKAKHAPAAQSSPVNRRSDWRGPQRGRRPPREAPGTPDGDTSCDQFKLSQHAAKGGKFTSTGSERIATTRPSELCGSRVARIGISSTLGGSSAVPVIPIVGYSSGYSSKPLSGRVVLRLAGQTIRRLDDFDAPQLHGQNLMPLTRTFPQGVRIQRSCDRSIESARPGVSRIFLGVSPSVTPAVYSSLCGAARRWDHGEGEPPLRSGSPLRMHGHADAPF